MIMKRSLREARRVLEEYSTAIRIEADGRIGELLPCATRIMIARLKYGVGPLYYSLYRFKDVPRSEWGDYVTDDPEFKQFLKDINPESLRVVANNKLLFHEHCLRHALPTIPSLCVVSNDTALPSHGLPLVTRFEQWSELLQTAPDELFVKPMAGTYGEGALAVRRRGEGLSFGEHAGGPEDLFRYLQANLGDEGGWLVQPRLRSDKSLAGIVSPHGLATVRAVTQMRDGRAELLIADMKITVGDNVIDNFAKGTSGNLLTGIDIESGRLTAAWGSARKDWPVIKCFPDHPETGRRIDGFVLPFWGELVDVALRAQESLPELKSLGWDIAATTEGIVLVEANSTYDVSILQIAHQRGLKAELSRALGRKGFR
jgi:Sugar-transfer associated ATP-grasp